jgi:hypothetical protein
VLRHGSRRAGERGLRRWLVTAGRGVGSSQRQLVAASARSGLSHHIGPRKPPLAVDGSRV